MTLITADARKVSPRDFAKSLGLRILTKEEKAAEWRAMCERFADLIEAGGEWGVPPPYLRDAMKIVEERLKVAEELRATIELRRRA
jgi:hypothetical protein